MNNNYYGLSRRWILLRTNWRVGVNADNDGDNWVKLKCTAGARGCVSTCVIWIGAFDMPIAVAVSLLLTAPYRDIARMQADIPL